MTQTQPLSPQASDAPAVHPLLVAPVMSTLAKLAAPNLLGMMATTAVSITETVYLGQLGIGALAASALVLPLIMLMGMMSAGAMGGGVSSAISRALGAGDVERAERLALHSVIIGLVMGLFFTTLLVGFGNPIFHLLGGRGETLKLAVLYAGVVFSAAALLWMMNILASILRGSGNMIGPSAVMMGGALVQILLGGTLCFGWGPAPRLGIVGVGLAQIITSAVSVVLLFGLLRSSTAKVRLRFLGPIRRDLFADILRVGAPALLSPIQTIGTILIVTAIAARFGVENLAGYGIGSRLEFLLVPIAFSVGVASIPMVGLAIGFGDVARARRVAWTAGAMGAVGLGSIGLLLSIAPELWVSLFTSDPLVQRAAALYLHFSGPAFAFFGLSLALYFASQGAGRIGGPLLAGTARMVVVAVGGWILVVNQAPAWALFAVVALGMVVMGVGTAIGVAVTSWEPRRGR